MATMPIWSAWLGPGGREGTVNLSTDNRHPDNVRWGGDSSRPTRTILAGYCISVGRRRINASDSLVWGNIWCFSATDAVSLFGPHRDYICNGVRNVNPLSGSLVEGIPQSFIRIDGNIIILIVFLGIFCGALGFYLWTSALTRLSPTQVAVYANANPAVAIILGVFLLGENLSGAFIVFLGVLVVGVLFVNWPKKDFT